MPLTGAAHGERVRSAQGAAGVTRARALHDGRKSLPYIMVMNFDTPPEELGDIGGWTDGVMKRHYSQAVRLEMMFVFNLQARVSC